MTNGAPAIFLPMLHYIESLETKPDLSRLHMLSGATEPPLTMMRGFEDLMSFQNTRFELVESVADSLTARTLVDHCISQHVVGDLDAATASLAKF